MLFSLTISGEEQLQGRLSPRFMSFFSLLSYQGQSSSTIIASHPTKPQGQSVTGFMNLNKTNIITMLICIEYLFLP